MSRSVHFQDPAERVIDPDQVRLHLKKVLESPAFRGSRRFQTFLEYVVDKALLGQADDLKERTLAVEVFGRPSAADLTADTIVRVGAREVRKRLAQYYVSPDAAADPMRMDLPSGAYVPEFHFVPAAAEAPPLPLEPQRPWCKRGLQVAAGLAVAGLALYLLASARGHTDLDQFWNPVFGSANTVLVAVAHPIVYHPSDRAVKKDDARYGGHPPILQAPIQLPAQELDGSDLVPVFDQYVGFGDLLSASQLAVWLTREKRTARFRLASKIEFADLKDSPAILIGAFTNRWSVELSDKLHFRFGRAANRKPQIEEQGGPRRWTLPMALADGSSDEDFILISRMLNGGTGKPFVILAGLKQTGTQAAGRLLTDPVQFSALGKQIPAGWQAKDLQLVLHTKVIGGGPAALKLVAWHVK